MATVSMWESAEASAAYAFNAPGGHPSAIDAQRRKDFHHESAFIRFNPIEIRGTLDDPNPFSTELLAAR